jgi:hypothetical protein
MEHRLVGLRFAKRDEFSRAVGARTAIEQRWADFTLDHTHRSVGLA